MGRHRKVQKSNKHKKLKAIDPFYSGARKDALLKTNEVNNAPSDPDAQHVPRKLKWLAKIRHDIRQGVDLKAQAREQRGRLMNQGGKKEAPAPLVFKKGKKESEENFASRVERQSTEMVARFREEEKLGLHPDEPDEVKRKRGREKGKKKESPGGSKTEAKTEGASGMSERNKRKLKRLKEKKFSKQDKKASGFEHLQDKVEFGEVVDRPPELTVRPRKAVDTDVRHPGKKDNLLLNQKQFSTSQDSAGQKQRKKQAPAMSLAKKSRLAAERERVVELYRSMKKKK